LDSPESVKITLKTIESFIGETLKSEKSMAKDIAKIDEKIRELKRKKKSAENQQMIKECHAYLKALNSSLKKSGVQIKRIDELLGFLLEQEANGNWVSKWLVKNRPQKSKS
jgi:peptidoglycan hydrolase CwlO-like protein